MGAVNLIPAERLARRNRNTRLHMWMAVCGVYAMMLLAGSFLLRFLHATEDRSVTAQLAAVTAQVEQENQAMLELRRALAETRITLETARAIHEQPDWSKLFLGVSGQMGQEIVLSRCQLGTFMGDNTAVTGGWGEAAAKKPLADLLTECRHKLVLHGFAKGQESVSRFVLGLEGSGAFDTVRVLNSSRQSFLNGEAVAFNIECHF
jgi:hypothetical protein